MTTNIITANLPSNANMGRVMLAFREAGATIIRAIYSKGYKGGEAGHWNIQYKTIGIAPDLRYI